MYHSKIKMVGFWTNFSDVQAIGIVVYHLVTSVCYQNVLHYKLKLTCFRFMKLYTRMLNSAKHSGKINSLVNYMQLSFGIDNNVLSRAGSNILGISECLCSIGQILI